MLLLAAALAWAAPTPAPVPAASALPGETVELKAVDGWALKGVYQKPAEEGGRVLVLLHGTGQRKEDWKLFARAAAKAGFGYFALDLRGHGESRLSPGGEELSWKKLRATKQANDYADMTRDLEAAVAWLGTQGVAEEQIGLVGAEVGSSIAVKHAAVHPKTPFVVMLSPGLAWQEIPLVNAVRAFKGRNLQILMVHSEKDKRSSKETPLLHTFAKLSVGEKNTRLMVVPEERGTRMLRANKALLDGVLSWIEDPSVPETPAVSTETSPGAPPSGEDAEEAPAN